MNRSVLKFGGTSVSTMDKIKDIGNYLKSRVDNNEQLIVVVSAMGDTTDQLINMSSDISKEPNEYDLAMLLSSGEQQSISYLSMVMNDLGVSTKPLTAYQAGILTVGRPLKSRICEINSDYLTDLFTKFDVLVIAGFQGLNKYGDVTTLGRGGSDITAVALASALGYPCEIYSDVNGVYSTDPSVYTEAKLQEYISYDDMMEMSALGAGILETRSVEVAKNYDIPIYLGKTLSNDKGTWIISSDKMIEKKVISGVALDQDLIHVFVKYPKYNNYLFHDILMHLEREDISIDMILEYHNGEGFQFSFTSKATEKNLIKNSFSFLKEAYAGMEVEFNEKYSKVSIVGSGMRDFTRVLSKALRTMIQSNIPFYQVTTSESSISFIVEDHNDEKAVKLLCEIFDL